jgi:hypothetical protein
MAKAWRVGMGVALALLGWTGTGLAQDGMIVGEVRTEDGLAVPVAEVSLESGDEVVARTVSDAGGVFRFVGLQPGPYRVRARALGYGERAEAVAVGPGTIERVELRLEAAAVRLGTVRVEGRRERARFEEEAGATVIELARSDVERLPGLAESDVLRAVEVLPGVISTSDFSASFNVRGGAADQNLILLDGIPIYNPFHLGGVFSVFNTDMVERTELLAGGFPARYGGRVSSVLDVRSDAGDGDVGVEAGLSLLASRISVSGGLPRTVARRLGLRAVNARLSARRSYFDVLLGPFFDFPYHLTDIQGVVQAFTGNGFWTFSGYTGSDVLDLRASDDVPLSLRLEWGNDVAGARWTGSLGGVELDGRISASRFDTGILFPDFADTDIRSRIGEVRTGLDLGVPVGRGLTLGVGGEAARLDYDNLFETGGTVFGEGRDEGWLAASYAQLEWRTPDWLIELGGRVDLWDPASADPVVEPAPRVALKRFFDRGDAAIKVAAGRYTQVVHSLRDEEVPIGIDLWVTAGARAPVVVSDQVQVGYERFLGAWSGSIEAYYRTFDGVVATNGADNPNDPADDFLVGTGTSWGADLVVRRRPSPDHRVDGWIALSYLQAERTFPDPFSAVPRTVTYAPIYDRRLDIDLVLRFPLPGEIEGGLRFNFGSGLPYTRAVGAYPVFTYELEDGVLTPEIDDDESTFIPGVVLGARNGERYPAYHRLDVSFRKTYRKSWGTVTPFLDLLNVYNRRDNVLFYFYDYTEDPPLRTGISMLPILPTLGAEVSF